MQILVLLIGAVLVPFLLVLLAPNAKMWVLLLGVAAAAGWGIYIYANDDPGGDSVTWQLLVVYLGAFVVLWAGGVILGQQVRRSKDAQRRTSS